MANMAVSCDTDSSGLIPARDIYGTASTRFSRVPGTSHTFEFKFKATTLVHGWYYRLCIDVDGTEGPRTFGDTLFLTLITEARGTGRRCGSSRG